MWSYCPYPTSALQDNISLKSHQPNESFQMTLAISITSLFHIPPALHFLIYISNYSWPFIIILSFVVAIYFPIRQNSLCNCSTTFLTHLRSPRPILQSFQSQIIQRLAILLTSSRIVNTEEEGNIHLPALELSFLPDSTDQHSVWNRPMSDSCGSIFPGCCCQDGTLSNSWCKGRGADRWWLKTYRGLIFNTQGTGEQPVQLFIAGRGLEAPRNKQWHILIFNQNFY